MEPTESQIDILFDRFAEPKQILFLSADLVGSTALKQKRRKTSSLGCHHPDTQEWASVIQFFFSGFNDCFDKNWSGREEYLRGFMKEATIDSRMGPKPILWKMIGDELVYRKFVGHRDQVKETIDIWIKSIQQLYTLFIEKLGNAEISIKCTAWIGEFPIQNKILIGSQLSGQPGNLKDSGLARLVALQDFESKPVGNGLEIDFIGPAIDIGFRLTKKATPRKFVLSIDTLYLYVLSEVAGEPTDPRQRIRPVREKQIFFGGAEALPGVLGGLPYPLFWIDMSPANASEVLGDNLSGIKAIKDRKSIVRFCEEFYKEQRCYIDTPYIVTDDYDRGTVLNQKPQWYDEEKKKLKLDMLGTCD